MATDLRKLKKFRLPAGALIVVVSAFITYMLRGGFRRFESAPYDAPLAASTNWNDVLTHPRDISVVTFQTGVVHMDACLNLDPTSPKHVRRMFRERVVEACVDKKVSEMGMMHPVN